MSLNIDPLLMVGRWGVRVLYAWETVAMTYFHVTPLSHVQQQPITAEQAVQLHSGPHNNLYVNKNFKDFNRALKLTDIEHHMQLAKENALKTGAELEAWIDRQPGELYTVSEYCVAAAGAHECKIEPECKQTQWSSLSLDPKAEIGDIDDLTRMIKR